MYIETEGSYRIEMALRLQQVSRCLKLINRSEGYCFFRNTNRKLLFPRLVSGPQTSQIRHFSFGMHHVAKYIHSTIRFNVPRDYIQVYQAPMGNYFYAICIGVFIGTISFIPIFLTTVFRKESIVSPYVEDANVRGQQYIEHDYEVYVYMSCLAVILIILNTIVRRCPLRIYYKEDSREFVACFLKFLPSTVRNFSFKQGEMEPTKSNEFRKVVMQDKYKVGSQGFILFEDGFCAGYYYNLMLGYDNDDDTDGEL